MSGRFAYFDPFKLDTLELCLWNDGEECRDPRLNPLALRILVHLLRKDGEVVRATDLEDLLDQAFTDVGRSASLARYIWRIRNCADKDKKMARYIRTVPKKRDAAGIGGYRFVGHVEFSDEIPAIIARSPSAVTSDGKEAEFILSMDGIIANTVGELIYERASDSLIAACGVSYERALEDFAFALVYGSRLMARWEAKIEPRQLKEIEPGHRLVLALPTGVYEREVFDEDLKADSFFKDENCVNQVRSYIHSMGECLSDPFFVRLCRDWLVREAAQYLGTHPSLFTSTADRTEFQFGWKYYRHGLLQEVPSILGATAFRTLLNFVPEYPTTDTGISRGDRYAEGVRVQFVSANVLTHLATMHQFEKNSARHVMRRLPYAIRCEVTKQASKTQLQTHVHKVVVRHALLHALRGISRVDRKDLLVTVLSNLRGTYPFSVIREMLGELNLLQIVPDVSHEQRAARLVEEIRKAAGGAIDPTDRYSFARSSVLKEIGSIDLNEYRALLSEIFPPLSILGKKRRLSGKTGRQNLRSLPFAGAA